MTKQPQNPDKINLPEHEISKRDRLPVRIRRYTEGAFKAHGHNFFEFQIINKSAGYQVVDDKKHLFKQGQVFFLGYHNWHEIHSDHNERHDHFTINFRPNIIFQEKQDLIENSIFDILKPFYFTHLINPLQLPPTVYQKVRNICRIMMDEYENPDMYYLTVTHSCLIMLLSLLTRACDIPAGEKDGIVIKTMDLINAGFNSEITNEEIAASLGISSSRLSQIVRKNAGCTVKDILLRRRLTEAKKLLEQTNLSVTRIIYECGFNDISYFHRAFKKDTGQTPRSWRELVKSRN